MTQPQVTRTSRQFLLNKLDFLKGFAVAVLTTPVTMLFDSLSAGSFVVDWKHIGLAAATGGLGYIIKNWLTPSQSILK